MKRFRKFCLVTLGMALVWCFGRTQWQLPLTNNGLDNYMVVQKNPCPTEYEVTRRNGINLLEGSHQPTNSRIPKIVHFIWCSKHSFRFNNYLSVLSAVRFLDPDHILFHYESIPPQDTFNYETWFDQLQARLHIFHPTKITNARVCESFDSITNYIIGVLHKHGGVFLDEKTVLTKNIQYIFNSDKVIYNIGYDRSGYIAASAGENVLGNDFMNRKSTFCPSYKDTKNITLECFSIQQRVYPKTFSHKNDSVSRVVNVLMYGTAETPMPVRHTEQVIPNIGHVLWLQGKEVDYLFYLSCLSLIYVAEVERLFIHGNKEPTSPYWDKLKSHRRITFIKISLPDRIYGNSIKRLHHMSDVFRANIMLKYGGIYSDVDVLWTKPIDETLLRYDAVAAFDWAHAFHPFPDYINLGVSLGRPSAPFWHRFKESMHDFKDELFGYNGLLKPYKIYEKDPSLILIHHQLQVMCFKDKCHPTWEGGDPDDWRKAFAYHWTWPTPMEFHNENSLFASNSTWAKIGKNVLTKAGLV